MNGDLRERLEAMRTKYLEAFPQDAQTQQNRLEAFTRLNPAQKEQEILGMLSLLQEKKALLLEKLVAMRAEGGHDEDIARYQAYLPVLSEKILHKEELLAQVRSCPEGGETACDARQARLKKQIAALELKRCRTNLDHRDCGKVNERIAALRQQYLSRGV